MLSLLKEKNSLLISSYTVDQYLGQFLDITILNSFQVKRICQVLALMISHVKHGDDMFKNFHQ